MHAVWSGMLATQRERLAWARQRAGYKSARAAALAMGVNEHTYRSYETGYRGEERGIPKDQAQRFARFFRVRLPWLLTGDGEPLRGSQQNPSALVIGKIGAGAKVFPVDGDDGWPVDDIPEEIVASCDLFEVDGDSMWPLFHDRDILAVERRVYSPTELIGRLSFVQLEGDDRYVKLIKRGSDRDVFDLESFNASPMVDRDVVSAGRIAWVRFAS